MTFLHWVKFPIHQETSEFMIELRKRKVFKKRSQPFLKKPDYYVFNTRKKILSGDIAGSVTDE